MNRSKVKGRIDYKNKWKRGNVMYNGASDVLCYVVYVIQNMDIALLRMGEKRLEWTQIVPETATDLKYKFKVVRSFYE